MARAGGRVIGGGLGSFVSGMATSARRDKAGEPLRNPAAEPGFLGSTERHRPHSIANRADHTAPQHRYARLYFSSLLERGPNAPRASPSSPWRSWSARAPARLLVTG